MPQDLFGGAITIDLPPKFFDVSKIRTVPDTQEVFVGEASDDSIIIELLHQTEDLQGKTVPEFYFSDMMDYNNMTSNSKLLWEKDLGPADIVMMRRRDMHVSGMQAWVCHGVHKHSKRKDGRNEEGRVQVYLAVIRIPFVSTDVLITYNIIEEGVAFDLSDLSNISEQALQGKEIPPEFLKLIQSFQIVNWELFSTEASQ